MYCAPPAQLAVGDSIVPPCSATSGFSDYNQPTNQVADTAYWVFPTSTTTAFPVVPTAYYWNNSGTPTFSATGEVPNTTYSTTGTFTYPNGVAVPYPTSSHPSTGGRPRIPRIRRSPSPSARRKWPTSRCPTALIPPQRPPSIRCNTAWMPASAIPNVSGVAMPASTTYSDQRITVDLSTLTTIDGQPTSPCAGSAQRIPD